MNKAQNVDLSYVNKCLEIFARIFADPNYGKAQLKKNLRIYFKFSVSKYVLCIPHLLDRCA